MYNTAAYIGLNIKRLREQKKMNITTLAEKLKRRRETVSGWENGRSVPPKGTQEKIANFFSVNVSELYKMPSTTVAKESQSEYYTIVSTPLINEHNHQAYVSNYNKSSFIEKLPTYPFLTIEKYKKSRAFEVSNSAMEPQFSLQDILLCEIVQKELWQFLENKVVAIISKQGVFIRELEWKGNLAELKAFNPLWENIQLKKNEILEIYSIFKLHRKLKI